MRIRFRTRVALTTSALTIFTIISMSTVMAALGAIALGTHYFERGVMLTQLAQGKVEQGLALPESVMSCINDQMIVSALLAAELVSIAENRAGMSPQEIADALRQVKERSTSIHGYPLVDEFWISDETGEATIHTEPFGFTFRHDPTGQSQASAFVPLLQPGAEPVVQGLVPREVDGQLYKYVGVTGVDKPRIVQIGASARLVNKIESQFTVDKVLERFANDTDVHQIAVLDAAGAVIAASAKFGSVEAKLSDPKVSGFCKDFLAQQEEPFFAQDFGNSLGVVTRVIHPVTKTPLALFIEYPTEDMIALLKNSVYYLVLASLVLIIFAVFVSTILSRRLTRPIRDLLATVRKFGEGELDVRAGTKADREFHRLAMAFNTMADSLQSYTARLQSETQQRERLESELRIGAEVQQSLLPVHPPKVEGIELAGWSRPARQVGGDFYDYIPMTRGRLGIAIGDATGKGLSAALLVSECSSVLRALAETAESPADLLLRVNKALFQRMGESGRFITLFFAIVDPAAGTLVFSCGGHPPPVLLGADPQRTLQLKSRDGLPLGVLQDCCFTDATVSLEAGDTLILYSDGVTDATAQDNRLYGFQRLLELLQAKRGLPLCDLLQLVYDDAEHFTGSSELFDDLTLVGMRFRGARNASA